MKFKKVNKGLVHVYTGEGKGKTSAALGLALRAVSYKKRVLIVQFIKGPWRSGELDIVKRLRPYLRIKTMGEGFVKILGDKQPFNVHKKAAQAAFLLARKEMLSGKYEVVILDEINIALKERLISPEQAIQLVKQKPAKVELVLTGRYAPAKIKKMADYVSEIRMVKHPFQKGILARPAVDY